MQNVRVTTLSDIAERMGISVNTVSRALRNCSDIGASTKAAVKRLPTKWVISQIKSQALCVRKNRILLP